MGLDMYLSAKKFVSGYEYQGKEATKPYRDLMTHLGIEGSKDAPSAEVSVNIGYWRKANAIHGWFVRELADGVDECQPINAPREKLEELRKLCIEALAKKPALVAPSNTGKTIEFSSEEVEDVHQVIMDAFAAEQHSKEFNDPNDNDPLRPTQGFFFGGSEKDEWYYQDLVETVSILNEALALDKEWRFEYQASW